MPTKAERDAMNAAGRERFATGLPVFAARWRAKGYEPTLSFLEQVKGRRGLHPRVVAGECLDLVVEVYGVEFTGRTRSYDVEHGTKQREGLSNAAPFYRSPSHVLAIALRKLQGRAQRTDAPGFDDEVLARVCTLRARGPVRRRTCSRSPRDLDAPGLDDEVLAQFRAL